MAEKVKCVKIEAQGYQIWLKKRGCKDPKRSRTSLNPEPMLELVLLMSWQKLKESVGGKLGASEKKCEAFERKH